MKYVTSISEPSEARRNDGAKGLSCLGTAARWDLELLKFCHMELDLESNVWWVLQA